MDSAYLDHLQTGVLGSEQTATSLVTGDKSERRILQEHKCNYNLFFFFFKEMQSTKLVHKLLKLEKNSKKQASGVWGTAPWGKKQFSCLWDIFNLLGIFPLSLSSIIFFPSSKILICCLTTGNFIVLLLLFSYLTQFSLLDCFFYTIPKYVPTERTIPLWKESVSTEFLTLCLNIRPNLCQVRNKHAFSLPSNSEDVPTFCKTWKQ